MVTIGKDKGKGLNPPDPKPDAPEIDNTLPGAKPPVIESGPADPPGFKPPDLGGDKPPQIGDGDGKPPQLGLKPPAGEKPTESPDEVPPEATLLPTSPPPESETDETQEAEETPEDPRIMLDPDNNQGPWYMTAKQAVEAEAAKKATDKAAENQHIGAKDEVEARDTRESDAAIPLTNANDVREWDPNQGLLPESNASDKTKQGSDPLALNEEDLPVDEEALVNDGSKLFSSHPIQNLQIGRFVFENTVIRVPAIDLVEFETLLASLPAPDRLLVKPLDATLADEIISKHKSSATKGFDSSVGRAAMERMKTDSPVVGTKDLGSKDTGGVTETNKA